MALIKLDIGSMKMEIDRLTKENEAAKAEALHLAMTMWKQHFKADSPDWEPLDYTSGIISQIDNMVAGICQENEALKADITQRKFMANVKTGLTLEGVLDRAEKAEADQATRAEAVAALIRDCETAEKERDRLLAISQGWGATNEALKAEVEYLKSPEGRSAEKLCACLKCITAVAKAEAERDRLREDIKQARLTISHGRALVNFGHVPTVRRALEWVLIDFDKAINHKEG